MEAAALAARMPERDTALAMSQENVESLRRAFEAFNRNDLDAAVADVHPDCEYIPSGALPESVTQFVGLRDTREPLAGSATLSTALTST